MTAAELDAIRDEAATQTARYVAARDRHTHTGHVFAHDEPLPPLTNHRTRREWETQEPTHETP